MLFLDWLFEDRDIRWLSWLEKPLAKIGQLSRLSIVIVLVVLVVMSETLATDPNVVLMSGALGLVTYLLVNGLGELLRPGALTRMTTKRPSPHTTAPAPPSWPRPPARRASSSSSTSRCSTRRSRSTA